MDQETLKKIRCIFIMLIDKVEDNQLRRIVIAALGRIEDMLGIERTIKPHGERRKAQRKGDSIDLT